MAQHEDDDFRIFQPFYTVAIALGLVRLSLGLFEGWERVFTQEQRPTNLGSLCELLSDKWRLPIVATAVAVLVIVPLLYRFVWGLEVLSRYLHEKRSLESTATPSVSIEDRVTRLENWAKETPATAFTPESPPPTSSSSNVSCTKLTLEREIVVFHYPVLMFHALVLFSVSATAAKLFIPTAAKDAAIALLFLLGLLLIVNAIWIRRITAPTEQKGSKRTWSWNNATFGILALVAGFLLLRFDPGTWCSIAAFSVIAYSNSTIDLWCTAPDYVPRS